MINILENKMQLLTMQSSLIGFWLVTALTVLILMTFVGVVAFKMLYRGKKMNSLILLGGGMIVGPLLFLFSLSILSYFLKGPVFLTVLFVLFSAFSIYIVKKKKIILFSDLINTGKKEEKKLTLIYTFLALNILLIYIFTGRSNVGGDVLQYWTIATSYVRGNYPTVMPYQPGFLTVYHTGTYLVMGLLHALTKFDIDRVHFFFGFYIMSSMFVFTTGMALKEKLSLSCLVPPIFGLILFGTPIILTSSSYQLAGINSLGQFTKNIFNIIVHYPTFDINIGSVGGGAISAESLIYIIHIAFGLAVFLLFVYTLSERDKHNLLKDYVLMMLLTNLNLSINEVFLPIQLFLIGVFFIYDYYKQPIKKILTSGTILALIFISLFFVIQNSMRDSLFTPSPEAPRFQIIIPQSNNIEEVTRPVHRNPPFQDITISADERGTWYLVDIRILILIGLALSLITRQLIPLVFSLSALISLLCKIFIWYTFSPWSGFRFFSQSHQLMAFAFGFLIIGISKQKALRFLALLMLLFVLPQVISSYTKILDISLKKNNQNYTAHNPENKNLKILSNTIPAKSRVLIVSFLPDGSINHYLSSDALIRYGLIVPLGPSDAKILNIATGIEWYDAASYLDSFSLKKLGIDYVYLDGNALKFLPEKKATQIQETSYFRLITETTNGVLFKVTDNYKSLQDETDPTLRKMVSQIEDNKKIYLDKIQGDIRRLMFLSLHRKHSRLFGQGYLHLFGGEYYMAVEIPFVKITEDTKDVHDIDYAVMRPGVNPSSVIYGDYQKIGETKFAYLWKRKN